MSANAGVISADVVVIAVDRREETAGCRVALVCCTEVAIITRDSRVLANAIQAGIIGANIKVIAVNGLVHALPVHAIINGAGVPVIA